VSRFPTVVLLAFALTLFTSATLLFLVQPMIGKMILPLLGGTPEVWNTCMVFFQAMLLAGYAYAHATTRWLGVRRQAAVHLFVLVIPLILFLAVGPLVVNKSFIHGGVNPIPGVLMVLLVSVGLPFFVVSTTSPLLQHWFSSTDHPAARDPYFLSTASNLGSMLALVGYPALVEPYLPLQGQRVTWAVGYGVYILLTGTCAVLLWKSGMAGASTPETSKAPVMTCATSSTGIASAGGSKFQSGKPQGKGRNRKGERSERIVQQPAAQPVADGTALTGDVTLGRRLRWIMLAFVPSSMLMGVTTYMTTDISAIPLLWVLPLGLYLLSFIIVFSKVPRWVHQVMILALPLLVLLLVFMMLSPEIKPKIIYSIMMHLLLMFLVCMVCHGEMVRDRPPTKFLTEFYMWMSFGGVLGGVFNALIAPVIFNSLAEYQLAMVAACLLLPPLVANEEVAEPGKWGRYADVSLVGLFLVIGAFLIFLRVRDETPIGFGRLKTSDWAWPAAAVAATLVGGTYYCLRSRVKRSERALDIALPMALLVLTVGLVWGLVSEGLMSRVRAISNHLPVTAAQFRLIMMFGLPAVLCYTFVERSLRFGLGVGAVLLAGTFTNLFTDAAVYEKRSYFGVLRVEVREDPKYDTVYVNKYVASPLLAARVNEMVENDERFKNGIDDTKLIGIVLVNNRLLHGTTLHGQQYQMHKWIVPLMAAETIGSGFGDPLWLAAVAVAGSTEDYTQQALTYYHRTGPVGHVMQAYNRSAADRIGVIGLGTGTLACYGRPGQDFVFYDIDRAVKDISFDRRDYFSYVCDARGRGVNVDLVLGDARLEIERHLAENPNLPESKKYSVLAVDAFSSDAIPIHLITQEAVQHYMKLVREDGVLAFHISNRYLDLRPVLANIAEKEGLVAVAESDSEGGSDMETIGKSASTWVVLVRKEKYLDRLMTESRWHGEKEEFQKGMLGFILTPVNATSGIGLPAILYGVSQQLESPWKPLKTKPEIGVWTDDYSNLLKVFLW
jgi:SAM-dependent methyltransferase